MGLKLDLTLREEHGLRVFQNRVLRKLFGPKREEVTREWKRLHNEELYHLYYSPNITWVIKSRRISWARQVVRMGAEEGHTRFQQGDLIQTTWKT